MVRAPMFGTRKFLKGIAKETDLRGPWIQKSKDGRTLNNYFTGYEFGSRAKGVGSIAALGYGGYVVATETDRTAKAVADSQSENEDIESLPGTRGDMVGYQGYTGLPSNNLQTSGDLVFALHKIRHGG